MTQGTHSPKSAQTWQYRRLLCVDGLRTSSLGYSPLRCLGQKTYQLLNHFQKVVRSTKQPHPLCLPPSKHVGGAMRMRMRIFTSHVFVIVVVTCKPPSHNILCVRSSDHGCTIAVLDWRSGLSKGDRSLWNAEHTQLGIFQAGWWALFGIVITEYEIISKG